MYQIVGKFTFVNQPDKQGLNYEDAPAFTGDSVAHEMKWNGKSLDELKGKVIRLEFQLKDADLYTFRAKAD